MNQIEYWKTAYAEVQSTLSTSPYQGFKETAAEIALGLTELYFSCNDDDDDGESTDGNDYLDWQAKFRP